MSYGIQIINKYGSIIIDETHQNFLTTASDFTTVSAGVSYPPSGLTHTRDLIFAAPAVNQSKTVGYNTSTFKWNNTTNAATSYRYIVFQRADLLTPATSGYGLQVFDSGGDLCYESTKNVGFRILAFIPITGSNASVTLPSTTTTYSNFQNVAILMNNSSVENTFDGYRATWTWTSSTTGRVRFQSVFAFSAPATALLVEILK